MTRRWTVGELAQATGLTVRALHHYDAIGLVRPSSRTSVGQRRYTEQDLRRLYRVRALSALGSGSWGDLLARLDGDEMPDPEQFMTTLELTSMVNDYFTQEQRDRLTQRSQSLGTDAVEAMKVEWIGLAQELMKLQQQGIPVTDPRVQALTKRWDEIGMAFHDGDQSIVAAADRSWDSDKTAVSTKLGWPAPGDGPDLVDYVRQARESR